MLGVEGLDSGGGGVQPRILAGLLRGRGDVARLPGWVA